MVSFMNKIRLLFYIIIFSTTPSLVFGSNFEGTVWLTYEGDGGKKIIILEDDKTFTYFNIYNPSGNTHKVFGDNSDTWKIVDEKLVISYNDGFKICSIKVSNSAKMNGNCINKNGYVDQIEMQLIE